jgi:hypothetical protein
MSLSRAVLDALLPGGSLWAPEDGGGLDQILDGIADSDETVREFLDGLARLRSPLYTPILDDLEREFGIVPDDTLSDAVRRARLFVVKTAGSSTGSADYVESKLRAAGFDVRVHINFPAVDPALFIEFAASGIFNNASAVFNGAGVQFGGARGSLLVNGPIYYNQQKVVYETPAGSEYWPLVFFIGGEATRDPVTGALTSIDQAVLPIERKEEFIRLVIQYKPLFSWCGLVALFQVTPKPDDNSFAALHIPFAYQPWEFV